jgi:hypothetical protein
MSEQMPVQPKSAAERVRDQWVEEMRSALEKMDAEAAVLPERVFVEHLLPLIAGAADGKPVDMELWRKICGTGFRGIDVVGQNGEIMFRCPAIHRHLPTYVRPTGDTRAYASCIPEILANTENLAKNSPKKAGQFLREALDNRVPRQPIDMERALQFDAILKRYGYPGLGLPDSVTGQKTAAQQNVVEKPPVVDEGGDFEF